MNQEPVLARVGGLLLDRLRREMVPSALNAEDDIKMAPPGADTDFRFGVFLHDIEEIHPYGPSMPVRVGENERRYPDRLLALRFLLFANRRVPFDGMDAMDEVILLEAAMRAVYGMEPLEVDGQKVRAGFHEMPRSEKASLWQSLNQPLQPAVYLTLEPVWVPSARIQRIYPVREVQLSAKPKGAGAI